MKLALIFLTAAASVLRLPAAVPLSWTVETTRAQPATFEAYQGETLNFEAALQSRGKPLEAPVNYSFFWQTNGMGNLYWEAPCTVPSASSPTGAGTNVLFATWLPAYDVGAKVYNCFIGSPSNIYHAAFQLRLRPSPGALPNALPLPTPVIDFAKVRVLNPPWPGGGGGGVDTNAVIDIIHATVDGAARPLPKYLHALDFDDSYPDAADEYYRSRGDGKTDGGCSAVRSGGYLYRNFDFPFDDRAEFVVRMSASTKRFASVGVAQVGTNLTESLVTSGKPSRWYKALPGATVDGINEHGVVAEINVVDGTPPRRLGGDIHPLAAVRWALDNGTSAEMVATSLAARIQFPAGWTQNYHWMIADETSTFIVENGEVHAVTNGVPVMTNFRLYPTRDTTGAGQERYDLLADGEPITNAWFTRAYSPTANWRSEFKSIEEQDAATNGWARLGTMAARRSTGLFWQSVHTSVYDITNRVLRVAVQETDDWYTFAVPSVGTDEAKVREIAEAVVRPVEITAAQALDDANTANTHAIMAQNAADTAKALAQAAQTTADAAQATAETAKVLAQTAKDNADTALGMADEAIDEAYAAFEHADDAAVAAENAQATADSKADRADSSGAVLDDEIATLDDDGNPTRSGIAKDDVITTDGGTVDGDFEVTGTAEIANLIVRDIVESLAVDSLTISSTDPVDLTTEDGVLADLNGGKYAHLSKISATDPTFSNEVATVARTVTPQPSPKLRVWDRVRQCWWVGEMVNGVIQWEVE